MTDAWEEVGRPVDPTGFGAVRFDSRHPADFYRARDFESRPVLLLRVSGVESAGLKLPPAIHGMSVSLVEDSKGALLLVVKLLEPSLIDTFRALCANLVEASRQLATAAPQRALLQKVLERICAWHDMLRRGAAGTLSINQQIGLFGELAFLRDVLIPRIGAFHAICAWRGPYGDEQDFLHEGCVVEVKTQVSTLDRRIHVSSVAQLDTADRSVWLVHQTLTGADRDTQGAFTLNELAHAVLDAAAVDSPQAVDALRAALLESGWAEHADYDVRCWRMHERAYFEVREGFPRILPSAIPAGVDSVSYSVAVSACEPFRVAEHGLLEGLRNGRADD